jgi:hypothetical protein
MNKTLPVLALSLAASSALALEPMQKEPGFSGYLALGAAGGSVESNFLAEALGIDLSNDKIYTYDSPSETTIIIPSARFSVGYTFSDQKTRVRLANGAVEDSIDFSFNGVLGLRHEFDALGSIELAALLPTPGVEVWEDPYLLGAKRNSTDKDSTGGQLTWAGMFGTGLELVASSRKIDIKHEYSGDSLGLSDAQKDLLDREGDVYKVELGYLFDCGDVKVQPGVAWIDRNLDGDAMAQDGYEVSLGLVYSGGSYTWRNSIAYQNLDGDKENPIFHQTNDAEVYLFASELQFPAPFGWDKWFTTVGVSWGENQSDIDFNKASSAMFAARLGRTF